MTRESDGTVQEYVSINVWGRMDEHDLTHPYGNASFQATEPDGNGTYSFEMAFPITLVLRVEGNTDIQGLRPSSVYRVYFYYSNSMVASYRLTSNDIICALDPLQLLIHAIIIALPTVLIIVFVLRRLKRRRRRRRAAGLKVLPLPPHYPIL